MRGRDFLGGVILGSLVGAALGLLLAPQSGEETRENISDYAGEMGEKIGEFGEKMKESSRQVMESGRDLLEQGKGKVASVVHRGKGDETATEG